MNNCAVLEVSDHVAHIRLNRPDKMNALDKETLINLISICDLLRNDPTVRVVIFSGEGRGFCAGLDLENFELMTNQDTPSTDLITRSHDLGNYAQHAVLQWRTLPVPVITAIHGVAFGGGLQLTLGTDIRLVHPETKLCVAEINWGLIPDMAGMLLFRDLVRPDIASDLVYTGRVFSGDEAAHIGLATHTSANPLEAAKTLARNIASKNPHAIRAAKRISTITERAISERILLAESIEQTALMGSPNQTEAVNAALEKRNAIYFD